VLLDWGKALFKFLDVTFINGLPIERTFSPAYLSGEDSNYIFNAFFFSGEPEFFFGLIPEGV
jgi:hypothetical protein